MTDNQLSQPASFLSLPWRTGFIGGFFSRHGGVSPAPFDSLNASYGVGDDPVLVAGNRQAIKQALGVSVLISSRQVHGDRIKIIDAPVAGGCEHDGFDALIADQPGVGIMIQQADCQAVVIVDPIRRVVANVHNGWRGSVANIAAKTVAGMVSAFGCDPARMQAAISPSLGPCCAEFVNFRRELPEAFHAFQVSPNHFDFWAITAMQLNHAGIPRDRITAAGVCTRCNLDYFSYRRDARTGRCATVAALL